VIANKRGGEKGGWDVGGDDGGGYGDVVEMR
jgi:hypothetical protein